MIEEEQAIIGRDWYPYGIEQNRPSIEALLQYTHEHGLTDRRVKLEELFAPSTMRDIPLSEGQQVLATSSHSGALAQSANPACQYQVRRVSLGTRIAARAYGMTAPPKSPKPGACPERLCRNPPVCRSLQQAVTLHQQGRLDDAERLYNGVLRGAPRDFDALHLLGVLMHQRGRSAEALKLIAKALRVDAKSRTRCSTRPTCCSRCDASARRWPATTQRWRSGPTMPSCSATAATRCAS